MDNDQIPASFLSDIKKATVRAVLKLIASELMVFAMYFFCTWFLWSIFLEYGWMWLYVIVTLAGMFLLGYLAVRHTVRHRKKLLAQLLDMGYSQAERLASEREGMEIQYKTFYLLNEYLYFPRELCLLPYGDIEHLQTIYHSTNGIYDGAKLDIRLAGNKKLQVQMKKIRRFRDEYDRFIRALVEKMEAAGNRPS